MMKLLIVIMAFCVILKIVVSAISRLFSLTRKKEYTEPSTSNWYGICDNCGKKSGLHRFHGKRYCAVCHATLKAHESANNQGDENIES